MDEHWLRGCVGVGSGGWGGYFRLSSEELTQALRLKKARTGPSRGRKEQVQRP